MTDKMIVESIDELYSFNGEKGAVSVPITAIVAGVFNGKLREAEEIKKRLNEYGGKIKIKK